jgi:hypothetical protein
MPVVVIEVSPPNPPAPLLEALVSACSASIKEGRCEASPETEGEHPQTAAVAIVRWKDTKEGSVGIEVAIRQKDARPEWQSRTLVFGAGDVRVERWRAVGLTIATLAGELASVAAAAEERPTAAVSGPESPPQAPPLPSNGNVGQPPRATDSASDAPAKPSPRASGASASEPPGPWLGAGAFGAPGVGSGVQLGGYLEGGFQTASPAFVRLTLGISGQPGGVDGADVDWITGSAAVGLTLHAGSVAFRPRAGLRVERLGASIDPQGAVPGGSASHVQLGAVLGADAMLARGHHGFFLGFDVWRNRSATEVRIGTASAGTSAATGWGITFGYRYRFGDV